MRPEPLFRPIEVARDETRRAQASAADPASSAWVSANAGTGKTHVLTLRVLRLLLAGTKPERILCLTYTKAAAAEMSKRVFDQLGTWATAPEIAVAAKLRDVIGRPATELELGLARTLFTSAIEAPGGLKVQTIHAFAERLLQRFPLEAGIPPGFTILAEDDARELKAEAIERTLIEATSGNSPALSDALQRIVQYAAEAQFDGLISRAVDQRRWLDAAARFDLGQGSDDYAAVEIYLKRRFGLRQDATRASIAVSCAGLLPASDHRALCELLETGTVTDQAHATKSLRPALVQSDTIERVKLFADYFNQNDKGKERPRARLMTKALCERRPEFAQRLEAIRDLFHGKWLELRAVMMIEASTALYRIAGNALQHYTDAKRTRGALDFDDLIAKSTSLLSEQSAAQWALYKLDDGLDHILVDEAQDTNPDQWDIIAALAREFFSGEGARDADRTIFAVGDTKQSIYSFQGALPERFMSFGRTFAELATTALKPWRDVSLNLSFRTVAPVLEAVDRVFADPQKVPGVGAKGDRIRHIATRVGQAGLVEIWPVIEPDETTPADPWEPLADVTERSPANRLADKIADQIKRWLDAGEKLLSEDRPIRPSDILILVRRRHPFAVPMVAALKRRGIPVAGSDRMALTEQIAVMDLMVLGDFLTLPEDDLALATVLKSPLFGFNDDQLLEIATGRKATLWKALLDHAEDNLFFKPAAETLKRWRAKADYTPPFEFYSSVLDREGARAKFLARLGPEAADALDEFVDIALRYDDEHAPSLAGFLARLRATKLDVRRDMEHGRNEVRVMTVHGAKGLEAPIVFLPDTCTTTTIADAQSPLLAMSRFERPSNVPDPLVWTIKGSASIKAVEAAREDRLQREAEERFRLLYVAMTRARDRLYIAGFGSKIARPAGCWYDIALEALEPATKEVDLGDGRRGWRLESAQQAAPEEPKRKSTEIERAVELPEFSKRLAPAEPRLSVPLAPSRLEPYAPDSEGEPQPEKRGLPDAAAPSPLSAGADFRFLRGNLTHALLQHLPSIKPEKRARVAQAFLDHRGGELGPARCASILEETLAILNSADFSPLFGEGSIAEVPIAAVIPRPVGAGAALDISGQIDRLLVTPTHVRIIDYKTNRPPPERIEQVAEAYLYQLAAYSMALKFIYPGHEVGAALLWTDGPRIMEIPAALLASYAERLWRLDPASLDAT